MSFDLDENDVLFTNEFINEPHISNEIDKSLNDEFKKYYEKEQESIDKQKIKKNIEQISFRSLDLSDDTDENNIVNTNKLDITPSILTNISLNEDSSIKRYTKEIKTYVNIDSRDRNKLIYNHAHEFKIFLGKTFYNVKNVKLATIEFPNTSAVINTSNNKIYWRNQEDIKNNIIDNITKDYPIYDVTLRTGSYIASTLATEMESKMSLVKRRNGTVATYHYFDATLDISTDIVTFTSLILTELRNNPFTTIKGSGAINIYITAEIYQQFGFKKDDIVYIVGAKTFAGITTSVINTSHILQAVDKDNYILTIEVNINASDTLSVLNGGGGNTVKIGKLAPFQLLFGEKSNTIAQNIGYPLENSSELVNIHVHNIDNYYQVQITLASPHNFTNSYSYIGQLCTINGSGTTPDLDGPRTISRIINNTTLLISFNSKLTITSLISGQLTFGTTTYDIVEIVNYNIDTVVVTTKTEHFLNFSDVLTKQITLYNTDTIPSFDGLNTVYGIVSPTKFVIPGTILSTPNPPSASNVNANCNMPHTTPLTTLSLDITGITMGNLNTTFSCSEDHNLRPGDSIKFRNLISTPSLINNTYAVESVPVDPKVFTINTSIQSYNIDDYVAHVDTGYMTLSFPDHNFNNIISIKNTAGAPSNNPTGKLLLVQTQLPHKLVKGDKVYLSHTNCVPSKNDGFTIEDVIDVDLFTIPSNTIITTDGTEGIIGLNQNFYLYNVKSIGGIITDNLNNKLFTVRKIIDENTITFYNTYGYASSSEMGGGEGIYISSIIHGFNGIQTNTKNNVLNRSINLQGENYVFLCCPQLATMMNTGKVTDIFARITLDQSPGNMVFSFLSNPKTFDNVPLDKLSEMEFRILNYDGSPYDFTDLDYSFTLEITEVKDITDAFNYSSRRGVTNN
jgi:hypothetical protein